MDKQAIKNVFLGTYIFHGLLLSCGVESKINKYFQGQAYQTVSPIKKLPHWYTLYNSVRD